MIAICFNSYLPDKMKNYGRLFNESPAPMYIYDDRTFNFLAVNDAALHQYGYSREEFLSMNATQIRPADAIEFFIKANQDVPYSYFDFGIWQHIRKNGNIFYVHIYAHSTTFSGRSARSVLAVDIDQKVKTETAVAEKSAEIIDILESITDGFYALNKNWEITYFNKAAEKILGRKREEIIGKNLWDSFPRSREGKFYSEYEKAMTQQISVHFEELYAPLGVWGSMNVYPTKDGIAVYFVDITTQHNYLKMIERQNEKFREITWSQSHEVRAPLANIMGLTELFNFQDTSDLKNAELMRLVSESAKNLDDIIKKINSKALDTGLDLL